MSPCVVLPRALVAGALQFLMLAPGVLAAQARDTTRRDTVVQAGAPRLSAIVRTVIVDRRPVFDIGPGSKWYERLMNRLHVTTRDGVVRREMLAQPGQPYDSDAGAESERNLRALNIFREVKVDSARSDTGLHARVVTGDAFTLAPSVSLRTSGAQASYGFGVTEANLLGRLINVGANYRHEPDRSSVEVGAAAPRIISDRVGVAFSYSDVSDGRVGAFTTSLPFLSYSARSSFGVDLQAFDGRVLRYTNGLEAPTDSLHRSFFLAKGQVGYAMRASPRGYTRISLVGQVRREDFATLPRVDTMSRTMTGALLLQAEDRHAHFVVVQNYRNIGPSEDVDLSTTVRLGVSLAPHAWGYATPGIGALLDVFTGRQFPKGLATLEGSATTLYRSLGRSAIDSGTFSLAGTLVLQPTVRNVAILYAGAGRQVNPAPGAEFDMGLTSGPRAFPQHAFTGDRYFFGSAEYRYTIIEEWLKLVGVGLAAFVDHGGAWFGGSPQRTGTDLGVGLRIGSSRIASPGGAARIDFGYRFANDAQPGGRVVALGRGFAFERAR